MKKKFALLLSVVAALALSMTALAGCGGGGGGQAAGGDEGQPAEGGAIFRTLDDIQASGKVTIGVFSDKHPFGYVNENGDYAGYDIELANRLAADMGVAVEYVSTEAANRVEYLETGKVDIVLANFTVTPERAEHVDFCEPYMNVALGVVSHSENVVTDLSQIGDRNVIVITGTTAETYLTENNPELTLQKFDTYANAKTAFENDPMAVWANDNTEVMAFAATTPGYTVGIAELGSLDTIAPAVSKGNESLLAWINEDMVKLGAENFFHADYEKTLLDVYGADYENTLVVEPGVK